MTFQELVTEAVRGTHLPQRLIGDALNIAQETVSQKMTGRRRWTLEEVEHLAAVLPAGDRLVLVPERETLAWALEQAKRAEQAP